MDYDLKAAITIVITVFAILIGFAAVSIAA